MPPPGFVITPLQLLGPAIEEQRRNRDVVLFAERSHFGNDALRIEAAGARIEADGKRIALIAAAFVPGAGRGGDEAGEQADREIVDRFPTQILQRAQGGRLTRTQQAGDQQDAGGLLVARRLLASG